MQTSSPAIPSNVLKFPARRFGRPRPSSIYSLLVRLFNQATSSKRRLTAALDSIESRYVNWRLLRSSKTVLRSLDDLIVLNARAYPGSLDLLVREIESRRRHWQAATTDTPDYGSPAVGPRIVPAN